MLKCTFYWACGMCGASPIAAWNGRRWFPSIEAAETAGKPDQCSNIYCHTRKDSAYYVGYDQMTVHEIEVKSHA